MSRISITSAAFIVPIILSACASDAPEPIRPAPVYDKMGNPGCVDDGGTIVFPEIPGTVQQPPLYLPDCDELCDDRPIYDANGQLIDPCPPEEDRPRRDRDDDDDDRDPTPGTPATFDPTRGT